jgi:DNA replication and repair protein RecF
MKGVDVSKYGSRGEQRMAVMWLKIGERDYLVQEDEMPILLLDDIFSELDHKHRGEVIELVEQHVSKKGQVIMTSADEHLVPPIKESKMIRL